MKSFHIFNNFYQPTKHISELLPKGEEISKMSTLDSRFILVSNRQKQNPVIKSIEKNQSVKYESPEDPIFDADFRLGKVTGALFLSVSYHKNTPQYIVERMKGIGKKHRVKR